MGGNNREFGGGILAALAIAVVAVLYFGFHMVRFGWILKLVFAGVVLFAVLAVGVTVWLIIDSSKQRQEKLREQERKEREAAEQRARQSAEELNRK